jgi:MtN3 and saliva related transmembrane protein
LNSGVLLGRRQLAQYAEYIGLAAGLLIALGWIPQVVRVWRMKDAQEISLTFNFLFLGGTILWLAYGLVLGLLSVILWNGVNLVLLAALLTVKLRYGMAPGKHAKTS